MIIKRGVALYFLSGGFVMIKLERWQSQLWHGILSIMTSLLLDMDHVSIYVVMYSTYCIYTCVHVECVTIYACNKPGDRLSSYSNVTYISKNSACTHIIGDVQSMTMSMNHVTVSIHYYNILQSAHTHCMYIYVYQHSVVCAMSMSNSRKISYTHTLI